MKDLNHYVCIGRLVKDAELHNFDNANGVLQYTLAVNTTKKVDGKFVDEGNFFDIKTYGKTEYVSKMNELLIKGKQVCVEGFLRQDHWEKDGKKNSKVVIVSEHVQLCGGSSKNNEASDAGFQEDLPYSDDSEQIPF